MAVREMTRLLSYGPECMQQLGKRQDFSTTGQIAYHPCRQFEFLDDRRVQQARWRSALFIVQELCESRGGRPGVSV